MTLYSAVVTTGIYCQPGCNARPLAENVRTFELAAAAEAAGFRACLRCRPYRSAGPLSSRAPELLCRAVRLIIDGVLDDDNEAELARHFAVSPRHLRRLFASHLGVTPDQLARSRRAHFARRLLDDTDLSIAEVAFASGFGSLRQFNREMRGIFRRSPHELRNRRRSSDRLATDGGLTLRLPFCAPYDWAAMVTFLAHHAIPGVESVDGGVYRRTISLDGGPGVLEVEQGGADHLLLRAHLPFWEGLIHVVERIGKQFGVDRDVGEAVAQLASDPMIGELVGRRPGIRVPGAWGPFEVGVRAIIAQDCDDTETTRRIAAVVQHFGQPVSGLSHALTHLFPGPEVLASVDLSPLAMPDSAANSLQAFAVAVACGIIPLDGSCELPELVASMVRLPGVGIAAAHQLALRIGEFDAFPGSDPTVTDAIASLGIATPAAAQEAWRPWRAVAAAHLMAHAWRSADSKGVDT
jgi:AraC family transcriptional regulator of adaptative response / DNA-3-methyladenine glycosylase II